MPAAKLFHAPAPVRTANFVTAPRGLSHASKLFTPVYWIISPAFSGAAARTSHRNRWSGARHWQRWPSLIAKAREVPGDCQRSTNWSRWWIAPPTARPCRPGILSPTCRTFTGRPPLAGSSPIGLGRCTWKKAQRASGKSGSHNFRYGPWQLAIAAWPSIFANESSNSNND